MKPGRIILSICAFALLFAVINHFSAKGTLVQRRPIEEPYREISGKIEKGDSLFAIFQKYGLDLEELLQIREASAKIYNLRDLCPGRPYRITLDGENRIRSFVYVVDDNQFLRSIRAGAAFHTEKVGFPYKVRLRTISGVIENNLISSLGEDPKSTLLAMEISEIFSWDIDFTTDLRKGDRYRILVEELALESEADHIRNELGPWIPSASGKYGNILAVEFVNDGKSHTAYRFEHQGKAGYYDREGKSLRKAFLKAPLNFKRISSRFSGKRLHPILKTYRPHHGVDYAAPAGTPVSATADGKVVFAGYKGAYGKLVILKHNNSYQTYYGHLSRIAKNIRTGRSVAQGDVIGYVGKTGLASGPHLHYEMRFAGRFLNPLKIKQTTHAAVPGERMADFLQMADSLDKRLAASPDENMTVAKGSRPISDSNL